MIKRINIQGSRRSGKTTRLANEAIRTCLEEPNRVCLLMGPTNGHVRILNEMTVDEAYRRHPFLVESTSWDNVYFSNGSRIDFRLPDDDAIHGYMCDLIGVEEITFVDKEMMLALAPMVKPGGRFVTTETIWDPIDTAFNGD